MCLLLVVMGLFIHLHKLAILSDELQSAGIIKFIADSISGKGFAYHVVTTEHGALT